MKWMNDIKVAYKMLILVVIAAIALMFVGKSGYTAIQKANDDMDTMYNQKLQAIYNIGECKAMMREMQSRTALAMGNIDAKRMQELKDYYQKAGETFDKDWSEYEAVAQNIPGVREQAAKVNGEFKTFQKTLANVFALSEAGKKDEAQELYNTQGVKDTTALRDSLNDLQMTAKSNAEKIYTQNDADSAAASRSMLIQSLVALFLLIGASVWIAREITNPLHMMMGACEKLRDGDFRDAQRQVTRGDEFGAMADVLVAMRTNLNKLMHHTNESSDQIAAASEELTASSMQSAQASEQVAQSVTKAAEAVASQQHGVTLSTQSVQQVSTAVANMQAEAGRVAAHANAAFDRAVEGGRAIQASVGQIRSVETTVGESAAIVDKLGERSKEIGLIVETISGIAAQTNLLALNAAIEAARAGEHGRGFAVVAEEVRKLAEQSGDAAQKITELISGIQGDTTAAVDSMQEGRAAVSEGAQSVESLKETFEEIRVFVDEVSKEVSKMAEGIKGIAGDTSSIEREVSQIDEQGRMVSDEMQSVSAATEEQSASSEEIASASDSLAKLAQDLQTSLRKFQF